VEKNTRSCSNDVLSAPLKRDLSTVAMRQEAVGAAGGVAVRVAAQSGAKRTKTKPGQKEKEKKSGEFGRLGVGHVNLPLIM